MTSNPFPLHFSITAVSEANTGPLLEGEDAALRPLTNLGHQQAARMGQILARTRFDLALIPEAAGPVETAAHILESRPGIPTLYIRELYLPPGDDWPLMEAIFADLGFTTLAEYREHPNAAVFERYADAFVQRLKGIMAGHYGNKLPPTFSLLLVGYFPLLNAIVAHRNNKNLIDQGVELALNTTMGEAEALRVYAVRPDAVMAEHITLR